MSENKSVSKSKLNPEDDAPEWTDEMFAAAKGPPTPDQLVAVIKIGRSKHLIRPLWRIILRIQFGF